MLSCALNTPRERGWGRIRTQAYNTSCLRPILNLRLYFYGLKNGTVRVSFYVFSFIGGWGCLCQARGQAVSQNRTAIDTRVYQRASSRIKP